MKHAVQHIHFTGIGGAGMSAIAEVLHQLGYRVTGSDLEASEATQRLQSLGVQLHIGHHASHIQGAQAVVTSTAVAATNPEVLAAHALRVPVVPRAVLLGELMRRKTGIAVAGTHGKTTTTSLVASVLAAGGADPSYVIGGKLQAVGANSKLGQGEHIVVEADESDASFLHLSPMVCVVTNIDADHMETYGHSLARLHQSFVDFVHRLPFYGHAVVCSDDAGVRAVLPQLQRRTTTYGLDAGADLHPDVRAVQVQALAGGAMQFVVQQAGFADLPVRLNLAGLHNVRNALAAVVVARDLGLPDATTAQALQQFAGVGRRFERLGDVTLATGGQVTVVDDYGHHPVELQAVISAARAAFAGRRLVIAFQPHRYTRTRDCLADFVAVLHQADVLLLAEVYAAGESPITGATGADLAAALQPAMPQLQTELPQLQWVPQLADLAAAITRSLRAGDVLITLGAGSIAGVAQQVVALLRSQCVPKVVGVAA
jgi:UDP-N-acetylmuramate--alanine ligase